MNKIHRFNKLIIWLVLFLVLETSVYLVLTDNNALSDFYRWFHWIIDFIICLFFLYDFFWLRMKASSSKLKFFTFNFIDFIASIPELAFIFFYLFFVFLFNPDLKVEDVFEGASGLRYLKVILVFRIMRLGKAGALFLKSSLKERGWTLRLAVQLSFMILFLSSIGLYYLEQGKNEFFATFWDCFWWSAYTMATIGYEGANMPVTDIGKVWSLVLCGTGIALIGVFTATVVDLFIADEGINERLDKIEEKIDNLTKNIDKK